MFYLFIKSKLLYNYKVNLSNANIIKKFEGEFYFKFVFCQEKGKI